MSYPQGADLPAEKEYEMRCRCGHVLVTSFHPINSIPVLPCCRTGYCPYCQVEVRGVDDFNRQEVRGQESEDWEPFLTDDEVFERLPEDLKDRIQMGEADLDDAIQLWREEHEARR
jgi:hypothetical protein